jgi:hypothetical protein
MASSFHQYAESALATIAKKDLDALFGGGSHTESRHIVVRDRDLTYRFTPHYHPWVTALTRRLLTSSTGGLQAYDTEFQTRMTATAPVIATGGGLSAPPVTIAAGDAVVVPDGVTISLGGSNVRLAGRHIIGPAEERRSAAKGDAVVVPAEVAVTRSNGSTVVLAAPMSATLVDGGPQHTLTRSIFNGYAPDPKVVPDTGLSPRPVDELDFSSSGAYSVYNWELFYHVPTLIAINLSRSQRYEEAMAWFHYIFDPTDTSSQVSPERYWKVRPFQTTDVERIESILVNLSTGDDPVLQRDTINAIGAWKDAPFRPHVVARYRQSAYMFKTVMAYLDNLIAWGDSLFRQDTGEAIDEAMQLYVLAANILGPRPQAVPAKGTTRPQTYADLRADLDEFGNAMRFVEGSLLLDLAPQPAGSAPDDRLVSIRSIGRTLYFGVPRNDKLLGYWDTVADRLFKIRNSLNIAGIFRQLPLFEPPIDPAMLARAAAAGLDTGAIVAGLSQPLPLVRFSLLHQKAVEVAQSAASLGGALLGAIEKEDGERLTLLRAGHERRLTALIEQVRYAQFQESIKSREALVGSLHSALTRYAYYERQLGRSLDEIKLPDLDQLDLAALAKFNLEVDEPSIDQRSVPVEIATGVDGAAAGRLLSRFEAEELDKTGIARTITDALKIAQLAGQGVSLIPDFGVKFHFWGLGGDFGFGGSQLGQVARFVADNLLAIADGLNYEAGVAAKVGGYWRREQEWAQQSSLAAADINQIFKQLRAAQLREAITAREWHNQQVQSAQSAEVEAFLNAEGESASGKTANKALYAWSKRETRGLYSQTMRLAQELAGKAQVALQHELGNTDLTYLQPSYAGGKEGLLSGEHLLFDLQRMDAAYHDNNIREYEITKHISLAQLDPLALITLRATGTCQFSIPEEWFDLDGPGHYFRRIRSVAVSVPCVTGPYTSINTRLSLLKSAIRRTADPAADVEETHGAIESVVTSSGIQDTGVFNVDAKDDRLLPFELSGAISSWSLALPGQGPDGFRAFDYDSITDVVLQMRLTAREGGDPLRADAVKRLGQLVKGASSAGRVRLFSLRHEFPSEWAAFVAGAGPAAPITLTLTSDLFPYWSSSRLKSIESAALYRPPDKPGDDLEELAVLTGADAPKLNKPWTAQLDPGSRDIWMLASWKG